MKTRGLLLLGIVVLANSTGWGQTPGFNQKSQPRFSHKVRSPEVHNDGRITFRFHAPGAKEVLLQREGLRRVPMTKDDQGVWSVTTERLEPDLYVYYFLVDGQNLGDPANPLMKTKVMGGYESIAHVPGPATLSWEMNDVPHGTVHRHLYKSKAVGEERDFWVYTPPGYDPAGTKKYPVLYLLHGVTEDASSWLTTGRANIILDNLIARGQAQPMLLVMVQGYGFPNAADRVREMFQGFAGQQKFMDVVATTLLEEVMPQVEQGYRVATDRDARAIAGLSMGGAQAMYIGLNRRKTFGYVGTFSGALVMYGPQYDKLFTDLGSAAGPPLRVLWMGCGTEDFLLEVNRRFKGWLREQEIRYTAIETPGTHAWTVWRRHLTTFLPLLFQTKTD